MAKPKSLSAEELPPDIRELIARDGDRCVWCSRQLALVYGDFSREHVIPASRGGLSTIDNFVLACGPCNSRRKSKPALAWLDICERDGKETRREVVERALARASAADVIRPSKLSRRARRERSKRLKAARADS